MIKQGMTLLALLALPVLGGCSTTTRYVTTSGWYTSGAAPAAATPGGAATPAAAAAPASSSRNLFVTYWEGECGGVHSFTSVFGGARCSKGNGKIVRCALQADNSLSCKDEVEANKALATD